jgi:hypothetical protein
MAERVPAPPLDCSTPAARKMWWDALLDHVPFSFGFVLISASFALALALPSCDYARAMDMGALRR